MVLCRKYSKYSWQKVNRKVKRELRKPNTEAFSNNLEKQESLPPFFQRGPIYFLAFFPLRCPAKTAGLTPCVPAFGDHGSRGWFYPIRRGCVLYSDAPTVYFDIMLMGF